MTEPSEALAVEGCHSTPRKNGNLERGKRWGAGEEWQVTGSGAVWSPAESGQVLDRPWLSGRADKCSMCAFRDGSVHEGQDLETIAQVDQGNAPAAELPTDHFDGSVSVVQRVSCNQESKRMNLSDRCHEALRQAGQASILSRMSYYHIVTHVGSIRQRAPRTGRTLTGPRRIRH